MCTKLELAKLERFTAYRYFIESLQVAKDKLVKEYQKTGDQTFRATIDNLSDEIAEAIKNRDKPTRTTTLYLATSKGGSHANTGT